MGHFINETLKSEVHLHVVVLLVDSLQVLLELLQLNEAVVCQLLVLLQLTVHFLKLERVQRRKMSPSMQSKMWKMWSHRGLISLPKPF